jgi:hypothetical protein
LVLEFWLQALEAFSDRVDRAHVFLEDDWLGGGGANHLGEPSERGGTPMGAAGIADIGSQQKGFEPKLGGFEVLGGVLTGAGEIPNGFIFKLGDLDRGEITRAHQACELDGVAAVGFDAITGLFRDPRGRHDPARMTFFA